jgi:hypothetical protein
MSHRDIARNVRGAAAKEFIKVLQRLSYSRSRWEVFADWTVLAAAALYNGAHTDQSVEDEYLETIKRYKGEEQQLIASLLALAMEGLEEGLSDFLGTVYEGAELSNAGHGQFFTPYDISKMLAQVSLPEEFPEHRIITIYDPCSGAGGMAVAACEVMGERGFDWQRKACFTLLDIDPVCFRMSYIQLSLIGASGVVILGDTLALEERRVWTTPVFEYTFMRPRLDAQRRRDRQIQPDAQLPRPRDFVVLEKVAGPQLDLFVKEEA